MENSYDVTEFEIAQFGLVLNATALNSSILESAVGKQKQYHYPSLTYFDSIYFIMVTLSTVFSLL